MEDLKLVYQGKTKDVLENSQGQTVLRFKDDMTGKDGVFDPGENQVGLTVPGSGQAGLKMTTFFFEKLEGVGIPTHFIATDLENNLLTVKKGLVFGQGLEVICRYKAVGSFIRRYGAYVESGTPLDAYVEFTLKDDERQDPLINKAGLAALDILSPEEHDQIVKLTQEISALVRDTLAEKGLELYDIKLEFGRDAETNEVILIDEISGGNMRVYKGEEYIEPLALGEYLFN